MSNYQRFQILSAARQDFCLPQSPVWVSRCQLSLDLESGKRLLQARMVNCSERTIRQVFLRVVCFGAARERLAQLELVPMQSFSVLPGRVFGDDRLVELPVKGVVYAEVYAQRVRFNDDTAWDEPPAPDYLAFKAEPVREGDPHYETLSDRARSGGVRNDCYFRSQQGLWVCTCGLPNGTRSLRCAHCGASRLWLEQHMDPNLLDAPPAPKAPEPVAPVFSVPTPQVTVVPTPIRSEPAPQPTIIVQSAPEPEPEEAPPSHAGRNAAIVCAVLLALALGAFCAWKWLAPYLRYQQALRERAAGNYDAAVALLEELGDYKDSAEQINDTLARKAVELMGEGKYQQAMELLETLEGQQDKIADCLYSLGVLAYNDHDPAAAMNYVNQLRERFPEYDKTETLAQYCCYSLGSEAAAQAAEAEDPALQRTWYETARDWFLQAGDYEDSPQRATECDYRIALAHRQAGELQEAILALEALGDYKDAAARRQDCMFEYVQQHVEDYQLDALAPGFLEELVLAEYPGAQELRDRLNGVGFGFELLYEGRPVEPAVTSVGDLTKLSIRYAVQQQDAEGAVLVLVRYRLPNGQEGRSLLNTDRSASGVRSWSEIPFPANCSEDGLVTLEFYDAARGEKEEALLDSFSFRFSYQPPEENPEGEDGGNSADPDPRFNASWSGGAGRNSGSAGSGGGTASAGGESDPTEESSPATGRQATP